MKFGDNAIVVLHGQDKIVCLWAEIVCSKDSWSNTPPTIWHC